VFFFGKINKKRRGKKGVILEWGWREKSTIYISELQPLTY